MPLTSLERFNLAVAGAGFFIVFSVFCVVFSAFLVVVVTVALLAVFSVLYGPSTWHSQDFLQEQDCPLISSENSSVSMSISPLGLSFSRVSFSLVPLSPPELWVPLSPPPLFDPSDSHSSKAFFLQLPGPVSGGYNFSGNISKTHSSVISAHLISVSIKSGGAGTVTTLSPFLTTIHTIFRCGHLIS